MVFRQLRFTLLLWALTPVPAAAAVVPGGVAVRLYDTTGLAGPIRTGALETARVTLGRAGAAIQWLDCAARDTATTCARSTESGELVLRVVRSGDARGRLQAGAAALRSPLSPAPLGDAFVDVGRESGVLATIYVDRVAALATASGASVATLLGHAIAHEIGHLLLGTSTHSRSGLMRPVWSRDEVRRGRAADWTFAEREAQAIRARLAARRVMAP